MQNKPSLTVITNTTTHITANTIPSIESTPSKGELIGRIIAMNLRNHQAQAPEKTRQEHVG